MLSLFGSSGKKKTWSFNPPASDLYVAVATSPCHPIKQILFRDRTNSLSQGPSL